MEEHMKNIMPNSIVKSTVYVKWQGGQIKDEHLFKNTQHRVVHILLHVDEKDESINNSSRNNEVGLAPLWTWSSGRP